MRYILITGANRGIGLELVRQYLQQSDTHVFAACRQPGNLKPQVNLTIVPLEVTDETARANAVRVVQSVTDTLDILINNAAINPPGQSFQDITAEKMQQILNVNAIAPLMMVQAFFGLLQKSQQPRVINISSDMGSLTDHTYGDDYGYCTSKAALNMITRGLAADLRQYGVISICLDPGWVKTDMGGSGAHLTPEESARGIINVIAGLTPKQNGAYLRWNGNGLAW